MRIAILAVLLTSLAVAPARADDEVVGLLDVRVEGVSDTAAEVFSKQIEESLGIAGLQVAPRARLREFLAGTTWNAACLIGDCLKELKTHAGVGTVIEAALVGIGPSYHYTITLLDTETGQIIRQSSRKCDVCTTDEAFSDAALEVVALVTNTGGDAGSAAVATKAPPAPASTLKGRRAARRAAVAFLGAAAILGAGGGYLLHRDQDPLGAAALGGAGAFAVAGMTCLGVSFSF